MREKLHALSIAVRRPMLDAMRETERRYRDQDSKRLYYLSMEFLMGRALGNNLTNLELYDEAKAIDRRARRRLRRARRSSSTTPPSATAASDGWPRASSIRSPRSTCPASATASTTSSASSGRPS